MRSQSHGESQRVKASNDKARRIACCEDWMKGTVKGTFRNKVRFDAPAESFTMSTVLTKLILLFACLAISIRSGPVPACQLDEVIDSWITLSGAATSDLDEAKPLQAHESESTWPNDEDTPEQVALDQIFHQTFGQIQDAPATPHVNLAVATGDTLALLVLHSDLGRVLSAESLSSLSITRASPPPHSARYLPLLI